MEEEVQSLPEFLSDKGYRELPWPWPPKSNGRPDGPRQGHGEGLMQSRLVVRDAGPIKECALARGSQVPLWVSLSSTLWQVGSNTQLNWGEDRAHLPNYPHFIQR